MFKVKTLNNISPVCRKIMSEPEYILGDDVTDPDAIFVRALDMTNYEFNQELKCIGRAGIGVNNIPIDRCSESGIVVFNTPGGNANGVKELFVFALAMASRDIFGGMQWVYEYDGADGPVQNVMEKVKKKFTGPEFLGKTLGVVGTGNVGSLVANAALDLGMKVYGYDPYLSVDAAWKVSRDVIRVDSLDVLLKKCDYLTLHCPLTEETRGMIDSKAISKMKRGARIINYARGPVVDEDAIIKALENGKIARYVADFPTERLINTKNAVLTPHLGGTTQEAESNCARMAAMEIDDYLKNGNIRNSVNMPTVVLERRGTARICIIHRNLPGMLTSILPVFAKDQVNIEHMTNKSAGDYAYSVFDVNTGIDDAVADELRAINGVLKVRVID